MIFAGNSTTFIGCILTLLVLCFFVGDNNFIQKLLKQILDESKEEINNILNTYQELIQNLKVVEFDLKALIYDNKDKSKENKKEEAINLLNKASLYRMSYENEGNKHKEELQNLYNSIKNGDEFLTSFLYTFLFCIVVFICDELYSPSDVLKKYALTFIFVLTIISSLIWIFKWVYYWTHINLRTTNKPHHKYHFYSAPFFLLAIIPPIISCGITAIVKKISPNISPLNSAVMFYLLIVALMGSIAIITFWNNIYRFTANFVIKHFACIIFSILLFCVGLELFFYPIDNLTVNPIFIRRIVISFILINGLVLPFIIPFFRMHINSNKIQKSIQQHIVEHAKNIKQIKEECDNFKRKTYP